MEQSAIFKNLNEKQIEAVTCTDGPVLVIAGAGSGKTRALTHRIAYLISECGVPAGNILAVTFTNKAANEMKNRVVKLVGGGAGLGSGRDAFGVWADAAVTIGTFHSVCVRILRRHLQLLDYESSFVIYDEADQQILMKRLMEEQGIDPKKMNPKAVLGAISNAKNQLINAKEFERYVDGVFMLRLFP